MSYYLSKQEYMHSEYSLPDELVEKKALLEYEMKKDADEVQHNRSQTHLSKDPALINAAEICYSAIDSDKRDLLSFSFVDEESLRAIAKRLNTNHEWIRQEIKRILKKIRKRIKKMLPHASREEARQVWDLIEAKLKEWSDGKYDRRTSKLA